MRLSNKQLRAACLSLAVVTSVGFILVSQAQAKRHTGIYDCKYSDDTGTPIDNGLLLARECDFNGVGPAFAGIYECSKTPSQVNSIKWDLHECIPVGSTSGPAVHGYVYNPPSTPTAGWYRLGVLGD